ncbi:MAG: hypothetical protein JNJ57_21500 [Saprospiraceae bacterium]|nr:hypothetical protein [Saprospiraceae bacterium]
MNRYLYLSGSMSVFVLMTLACGRNRSNAITWHQKLTPCPCENPDWDSVRVGDGWARDLGNIAKYHAGSTACFRSYPSVSTSEGRSGQQCCYDAQGKLILCGSGAGTPDMISTCNGEDGRGIMRTKYSALFGHWRKDVRPWEAAGGRDSGWVKYNLIHPPNTGDGCR